MNLIITLTMNTETVLMGVIHSVLGLLLWGFLIVKIGKQPRNWGLGVSIFSLFISVFQALLWMQSMSDPKYVEESLYGNPFVFALYEVPLIVGGVSCLFLRFIKPVGIPSGHAGEAGNVIS